MAILSEIYYNSNKTTLHNEIKMESNQIMYIIQHDILMAQTAVISIGEIAAIQNLISVFFII
jgi:hypothetical protein